MADKRITQLDAITTIADLDVLPIVDLSDNTTKKITVAQTKLLAPVQSVNGSTGAVTVQPTLVSGTNIKTINSTSLLGSGNVAVQPTLVSGTNIKTVNGSTLLGSGDLTVTTSPSGNNKTVQFNSGGTFGGAIDLQYDSASLKTAIGTGTFKKKLSVYDTNQCTAIFESNTTGAGISFRDSTTSGDEYVGVGAFGNLLCLRGNNNASGTIQVGNDFADFRGNILKNFTAAYQDGGAVTIDSTTYEAFNGQVYRVTGAVNITIDNTVPDGFSLTVIQMDATQCTVVASGTLTLRNRQGHSQSAGQWAVISIIRTGTDLVLTGDTA